MVHWTSSLLATGFLLAWATFTAQAQLQETALPDSLQWPKVERQMRPWTRWWWLGSAVDRPNLTHLLETYHEAGLGGVEITPIYGVTGAEDSQVSYLTTKWLGLLKHTIDEANRLDMGVDMPTGTGWPFGGPNVSEADSLDKLVMHHEPLTTGKPAVWNAGTAKVQALTAVSEKGETVSLLAKLDAQGTLNWTPPPGNWTLYAVSIRWSGMRIKRAAPGGEGRCINPFSRQSLDDYLQRFNTALADLPRGAIRAQFHDSFEYTANWAPDLFTEFRKRRGYDLADHLPALAEQGDPDEIARVRTDCRETLSDMLLENFLQPWTEWAHQHGSLSREQAHGSPGNLLDLYGAADIPETEIFHSTGDIRISKFASSAAHVMGRSLASSESGTWLGEHFTVTLGQMRLLLDRLMIAGINHIFYHGTAYSPADAAWPGWLFYAATDLEPTDAIWHDFPTLNAYVARCQSILQSGKPDNEVLLYWPLHDLWQKDKAFMLPIEGRWYTSQPVSKTAQTLWDRGYGYDNISDRQLALAKNTTEGIHLPGGTYHTILIPPCDYMPETTLQTLWDLAHAGATILFQDHLPKDVPGQGDLTSRRQKFQTLLNGLKLTNLIVGIQESAIGTGRFLIGNDLEGMLTRAGTHRESLTDHPGLMLLRRTNPTGHHYFLINQGTQPVDGWVDLATPARTIEILDPMTTHAGLAKIRTTAGKTQVYLQLPPNHSLLLRTFATQRISGPEWRYNHPQGDPIPLSGPWKVEFISGGPTLPKSYTLPTLTSWADSPDPESQRFAGTARYTLTFDAPQPNIAQWQLDLGEVHESAHIRLNGQPLATLLNSPYQINLGTLKPTKNILEIEVTNLSANRIRDLDRRKVNWKIFHEINFVGTDYKRFDASNWPIRPSGLLGPVSIRALGL